MSPEPSPTANDLLAQEQPVGPDEWVDRYGDTLYRFALVRLGSAYEAEDAVQETFLAAIAGQEQFKGAGSQRSWLITILRRKVIDAMRARSKRRSEEVTESDYDSTAAFFDEQGSWRAGSLPVVPPDNALQTQELWHLVRHCLRQLAPQQADVFVLCVIEEMTVEQVCQELDISPSNLWVRLHRARLKLAKCVAAKWFHHEQEDSPS